MIISFKNKHLLKKYNNKDIIEKIKNNTFTDINYIQIYHNQDNIFDYIINNNNLPKNINNFFKLIISFNESKYLDKDLIKETEKLNRLINKLIKDYKKLIPYKNMFIYNCFLYNVSYVDVNKKDILSKYNKFISLIFNNNKYKSNIIKKTFNRRIKILFIGFYMIKLNSTLTSVFRDRSEIIKSLNHNIFEKHLLIHKTEQNSIIYNELLKKVDRTMYLNDINNFDKNIEILLEENYDIVVYPSIGMDWMSNLFAHCRLAPIQITTWGHSITSGIDTIDYYISSSLYELPYKQSQEFYSEKLILLKNMTTYYLDYMKLMNPTFKTREELKLPKDKYIICCMQNIVKINKEFIYMLLQIITKLPNSIILFNKYNLKEDKINKIQKILNNKAIFLDNLPVVEFNSYINCSDILLEPYPFGGCNTSLEAFSKGKIIITRPSRFLPGRFTLGFYKKLGITEPIVKTYNEFIEKTVYYLTHKKEREELEKKIYDNHKVLYKEQESIDEWQQMLIDLYKKDINSNFNEEKLLKNKYMEPILLLNSNRFDIILSYIYIKYSNIYGYFNNWTIELYRQHIQLLYGSFYQNKNNINDFLISFQNNINSFNSAKYIDIPIEINNNKILLCDNHITACHIYYNRKVLYKERNNTIQYHSEFFKNRELHKSKLPIPGKDVINNIDTKYIDFAILEYIMLKKNVQILCIDKNNYNKDSFLKYIFSKHFNIVYSKEIKLSDIGLYNFTKQFSININNMIIYILEPTKISQNIDILELKKIHNNIFINNTLLLAKVIFNNNTLNFYNTIKHDYDNSMITIFNNYTKDIKNIENYCIISDFIEALYGKKKVNKINYIHNDTKLNFKLNFKSDNIKYNPNIIKKIIYNPDNYFYFNGYKCNIDISMK